jgi:FkbM family methyltransferase
MPLRESAVRFLYRVLASPKSAQIVDRLESISERQRLGRLLAELRIDCVIDVGANEGQYARLLRRLGFTGLILSFEPSPDVFRSLSRALAGDSAWRGYNCGLGAEDRELDFNIFEHSQVSSFLPRGSRLQSKLVRTLQVPLHRLDCFLLTILPDWSRRRLFLKCDTQGFDVEVVKGSQGILPAIQGLQSELAVQSLYEGMPSYIDALRYYESLGYVLTDLLLNNRTTEGDALEYDCLMRRKGSLDR